MLAGQLPASNLDIRPYLHIHDLDFRLIVNANKPPTGVIVGVTVSVTRLLYLHCFRKNSRIVNYRIRFSATLLVIGRT